MANVIKLRRSAVQGNVPTTGQLELGEIALNTYDGKLFIKKDDGTASVVEIGGGDPVQRAGDTMTGALGMPVGSAASPSVYFDADTGLYSPGADQVAISTGGTGRLFIDASGNIGVGTANPGSPLHIQGVSGTYPTSIINHSAIDVEGEFLRVGRTDSAFRYHSIYGKHSATDSTNYLQFRLHDAVSASSQSTVMTLNGKGRVGINTTSPIHTLDVNGNCRIGSHTGISNAGLYVTGRDTGNDRAINIMSVDGNGGGAIGTTGDANADNGLALSAYRGSGYFSFRTGGTDSSDEKARIDSAGRLLVGTSTAGGIAGTIFAQGNSGASTGPGVVSINRGSSPTANGVQLGILSFSFNQNEGTASIHARRDAGTWSVTSLPTRLEFFTTADGATTQTERMRISANGDLTVDTDTFFVDAVNNRVGVGTTSPSDTFVVDGNIRATQIGLNGASPQRPLDVIANTSGFNAVFRGRSSDNLSNVSFTSNDYATTYASIEVAPTYLAVDVNGNERARIDSSGRLLVGTSSARSDFYNTTTNPAQFQIEGTGANTTRASIVRNDDTVGGPQLILAKSRGSSNGANNLVSDGDIVGLISFQGADGSEMVESARISAHIDGTPGANDMPGRLTFLTTANGATDPTERMRIASTGALGLSGANYGTSGQVLTSQGSGAAPQWADAAAGGGAVGGGSDKIFTENGQTVTTNYTIGTILGVAANAVSAGPITINSGVTVTIPSGSNWVIV